jgi:hypothetical protein
MPIIEPGQIISVHSVKGVLMYQFAANQQSSLQWGRQLRDVSKATMTAGPMMTGNGKLPDIYPWVHWMSIWAPDAKSLYWTGPIQKFIGNRFGTEIDAFDPGAYLSRTRVPLTKSWDGVDPCIPMNEMWQMLCDLHGLTMRPVMRRDPWGDLYSLTVTTDSEMMDKTIKTFESYGLRWTVVAGTPLIGPMPLEPIASLGENHFIGDGLQLVRDGTNTYNDILLKGPDDLARARIDLGAGVNLQQIVTVNNMFGVSNVTKATAQYVRQTGMIKTDIDVPSNALLHPDAPVTIDQLVPSARFAIEAYGVRLRMELESISVNLGADGVVQIIPTFQEVPNWTELGELQQNGGQLSMQAGVQNVTSP